MKIAIVCDWLTTVGGAEKVLEQMLECFPEASLFATVEFLPPAQRSIVKNKSVTTSYIQRLPFAKTKFRHYVMLMPFAIEQFDFSEFDVVISSSHAIAKGVITSPHQLHICYCHSPMRYAWDLQGQYLKEANLDRGFKSFIVRYLLHKMRIWDVSNSNRVDYFIANSNFIAQRIYKYYHRQADKVIYPPAQLTHVENYPKGDFYLTVSRVVPYKKIGLIVDTFMQLVSTKLVVIGDGPLLKLLKHKARANKNIIFLGYQSEEALTSHYFRAKALVFAAEEDFGIVPVEAQACGTPVIAYAAGGVLESVNGINANDENSIKQVAKPTGVFYDRQTNASLANAITVFERNLSIFKPEYCKEKAALFSQERFRREFKDFVLEKVAKKSKMVELNDK